MRIETKHFYLSVDRHGFTIALFGKRIDVELHFGISVWRDEGNEKMS